MAQDVALSYFQGELYDRQGLRLEGIIIDLPGGETLDLDKAKTGRLFMIPDGSCSLQLEMGRLIRTIRMA